MTIASLWPASKVIKRTLATRWSSHPFIAAVVLVSLSFLCFFPGPSVALGVTEREVKRYIADLEGKCRDFGWRDIKPSRIVWQSHRLTPRQKPLVFFQFGNNKNNCTLFLGGVHGDETPTVYLLLKLAEYVHDHPQHFKDKSIIIAPLVNPDGFFSQPQKRVNINGVDINRNFPTKDWTAKAHHQWQTKAKRNKRYYPGRRPGSEQETGFQIALIKRFKPQKILSIHSPLGLYDYDGPTSDLDSFDQWLEEISKETGHPKKKFGYFPGSLGNYAGHERNIFTLTLELRSSNPAKGQEYYDIFQVMMLKFLNLPIESGPPFIKVDHLPFKTKQRSS